MIAPEVLVEAVTVRYRRLGRRASPALLNHSMYANPGSVTGLRGSNAAGKSTLIALIFGLIRPESGRVAVGRLPPRRYRQRQGIGYVPEELARPPGWTAKGLLEMGAWQAGLRGLTARKEIECARERIGAEAIGNLSDLSKGSMRRLAISYALIGRPAVLLLDEPESGLDYSGRAMLVQLFEGLREEGTTVVVASHDAALLDRVSDRVNEIVSP